ncbi:alkaline phosphatase [Bifidobacterium pullorum]|uniref:alkaline phosphatase n=1 Tax=Bifidobacterium pullorum TaxID=78448 RepID=UPI0027B8D133|nr:alkaline phosphatase [Bifidobacterium pullorum]
MWFALNALEYTGKPVLALMAEGNLQTQFAPSVATKKDPAKDEDPIQCAVNPDWLGNKNANGNSASLADMTDKAIDLLQANPKSRNGFFLQVEGASIDKQDHNANACGQIGETDDLDKAISAALKKVDLKDTLIIVTADHAHTSQIVNEPPAYALSTILVNKLGERMVVSYGTAPSADPDAADPTKGYGQGDMEHTGTQLRIAASGPGAQRVNGLTDQTDNFFTIANALDLAETTDQMKTLSDGADANLVVDEKGQRVEFSGFNGDASVTYTVTDPTNGDAVIATSGEATDPVSGVRVRTDQTMSIDLTGKLTEGKTYRVTITGRQSGKVVAKDFQAPAAAAGDDSQVVPGETVENPGDNTSAAGQQTGVAGVLDKTGSAIAAVVVLIAALVSTALALKTVKGRRH